LIVSDGTYIKKKQQFVNFSSNVNMSEGIKIISPTSTDDRDEAIMPA